MGQNGWSTKVNKGVIWVKMGSKWVKTAQLMHHPKWDKVRQIGVKIESKIAKLGQNGSTKVNNGCNMGQNGVKLGSKWVKRLAIHPKNRSKWVKMESIWG